MSTRKDHIEWCKARALAYCDQGDVNNALASMASDIRKHPDTDTLAATTLLGLEGVRLAVAGDVAGMRRFIEGFN